MNAFSVQSSQLTALDVPAGSSAQRIPSRVWMLIGILGLEFAPISLLPHPWHKFVPIGAPLIVFFGALLFFARKKFPAERPGDAGFDTRFAGLHLLALTLLATAEFCLLRGLTANSMTERAARWSWYGLIFLLIPTLVPALFPGRILQRLLRSLGDSWVYALAAAVAAVLCKELTIWILDFSDSRLSLGLQSAAFAGVKAVLGLFYTGVISDPSTRLLGTPRFQVEIAGRCSGIEGLGLGLALTVGWLIFARRELRLERALLLIPVTLAAIWALNVARISALIAIGDAGYGDIALHGFHSLAGWLIFNAVALAFLLTAQHLRWLQKDCFSAGELAGAEHRNAALIYLLPCVAVLATTLIARAASANFDWLYPLRLAVALAVLWHYRAEYRKIDWRCGWLGPLAGAAVFAMWLGVAHRPLSGADDLGAQLARLAPWQRVGWIAARAFAAVVTVPIVEELAFRGYIARRVMSDDVEAVPFGRLSFLAIAISSLAFGSLHGNMWIAGMIAGVVFAVVAKLRNRIGEAVAAHATANLLIVAWVLARGDYRMW